jgi:uncharacterized protein (TIGR02145 family)
MKDASGDDIYPAGTTVQLPLTGAGTTTTFEPGTSYNLQFTFGAGGSGGAGSVNEIQFSVSVTDWDDTSVPLAEPEEPVALERGGSNSYMIHPDGSKAVTMNIPLSRIDEYWSGTAAGYGNNPDVISNDWTADVLWSDITSVSKDVLLSKNSGSKGAADYFTVEIPAGCPNGNFVVEVKNENDLVLWSWHIWVTNYAPEEYDGTGWATPSSNPVPGGLVESYNSTMWQSGVLNGKVMMDRSLGSIADSHGAAVSTAASVTSRGQLYYQFGRKDPFPTSLDGTSTLSLTGSGTFPTPGTTQVTIAASVNNPTTFYTYSGNWTNEASGTGYLWNDFNASSTKSIFDPCPDGWRLPLNGTWADFSTTTFTWAASPAGRTYNSDVFYAAAGFRVYSSGGLSLVGTYGYYWSATPYGGTRGQYLYFFSSNVSPQYSYFYRAYGFPVRCSQEW